MKKVLFIILLFVTLAHFAFRVYQYKDEYLRPFDAQYWEQRYLQSQWVDPLSKNPIGDDGLYAYAGYAYITGRDPTTLNAELPPLGKYAIGASILVFKNQNVFALISGSAVLLFFYLLNLHLFKDKLSALIPVTAFSLEPLFYTQLRAPFVDLFQLSFLFLSFLFFLKKRYIYTMLFFGCMISVKATSGMVPLFIAVCLLYLFLLHQYQAIKKFLLLLPLAAIVFMLTYLRYFMNGHTIIEFLGVQKYIVTFYAIGAKGNPTAIWHMLTTGTWPTHWGEMVKVGEWWIGWLVLLCCFGYLFFVTGIAVVRDLFFRKRTTDQKKHVEEDASGFKNMYLLLLIWVAGYLAFLMVVPVWPRYLLLLLPFLYNLSIWLILKSTPVRLR